jgi:hypothetical protein
MESKSSLEQGMVAHSCSFSSRKAEAERLQIQGQPGQQSQILFQNTSNNSKRIK